MTLPDRAQARALLTDLYQAAVTAAAPGPALTAVLDQLPPPTRQVHLLALGKAAGPMAEAAVTWLRRMGRSPAGGVLVVPEPTRSPHPALLVRTGDHPEPGAGSLAASDTLAHAVAQVAPEDEVWVLLSGGTTSLIGAPLPGLDPAEVRGLYHTLLGSGLDIGAMNRVRKRFTRWSGGRLAAALHPAHVKNFTISDVIGDDPAAIGSGPTAPDPATASEIRTALGTAGLWEKVPATLRRHLDRVVEGEAPETPKPGDPAFARVETTLVASNRLALEAVCRRAAALGLAAHLQDAALAGEASEAGHRIAADLATYHATNVAGAQGRPVNKHTVRVWGGETTVRLDGASGLGGRSQELALAAARTLAGPPAAHVTLLAAGTDGRDGPTDAAGGFADPDTWEAIRAAGRDPERDLAGHDAYPALEAAGALFRTGMTGTNVMDVVIGLVG